MIGPLLFLIYINDLSEDIKLPSKLFADDTKVTTCATFANVSVRVLLFIALNYFAADRVFAGWSSSGAPGRCNG